MSDWKQSLLVILVSFIIISTLPSYHVEAKAPKVLKMSFPNFSYRKKPYNEKGIKTKKNSCEMHPDCQNKYQGSIDHTNCVRSCMSASCYDLIYAFDELEPGEVDVRYNSFKGCFTKERSGSDVIALNNDANADRKGSFMSQMK